MLYLTDKDGKLIRVSGNSNQTSTQEGGNKGAIPTIESLDNPTAESPTLAYYNGDVYILVDDGGTN